MGSMGSMESMESMWRARNAPSLALCVLIAVTAGAVMPEVTAGAVMPAEAPAAPERQKQVLVLYALRRDAQLAVVGERELPRILRDGLSGKVDYYSEFIDQARFADADYSDALRDFLRLKYNRQSFDIVIAMGDVPLEFVERNRATLFPGTAVVFFSTRPSVRRLANSTGVIVGPRLADTLAFALELQPDTRQAFVVASEAADKVYQSAGRAQLEPFRSRVSLTYLFDLPTRELEARLAALPAHSVVYFLIVERDPSGENFLPLEFLERLTAISSAPVYCWVDSAMDRGILGGSLKDQAAQARALGALALRVLHGEPADRIPMASPDLNVRQVDWRQLRRWGISDARIPSGTLVMFREESAWDRYRIYILGAMALLLAESGLIAGLLVQKARRRYAEELVRGSQAELRASYERIRDLGGRMLNAQETERARIARELHDDISQQMALLEIDLEVLSGSAEGDSEELAGEALIRAQRIARSVHDLSHRLHPAKLRLIGLVSALRGLQRELSHSETTITFTYDDVPAVLPPEPTLCVFRIVQEVLQNALKYSGAHEVSVHLRGAPEALVLTILDDGIGFDVDAAWGKGLGLISINERVEAIGGTFELRSRPGEGTRVEVIVPLRLAQEPATVAV
jgi:signal transduction histidine kinase